MTAPSASPDRSWLDRLGVAVSALCLVQCLMAPVLITVVPAFAGSALDGELFHRILVFVVLPLSGAAFFIGCRRHRDRLVLVLAILGLSLISVAALLGYARLTVPGEIAMTLSGSLVLAAAHLRNFRLCRDPGVCSH